MLQYYMRGEWGEAGGAACTSYETDANYSEVVQCSVHPGFRLLWGLLTGLLTCLLVAYAHRLWIGGLVGTAAGQMAAGMTLRKLDVLNCACGVKGSSQAACSSLRRKIGRWLARLLVTPLVASHPLRTHGLPRFTSPCLRGPPQVL